MSPGYPGNYPDNANYKWILRTGQLKAKVNITLTKLDIKKYVFNPCGDYLQVSRTIHVGVRFCLKYFTALNFAGKKTSISTYTQMNFYNY